MGGGIVGGQNCCHCEALPLAKTPFLLGVVMHLNKIKRNKPFLLLQVFSFYALILWQSWWIKLQWKLSQPSLKLQPLTTQHETCPSQCTFEKIFETSLMIFKDFLFHLFSRLFAASSCILLYNMFPLFSNYLKCLHHSRLFYCLWGSEHYLDQKPFQLRNYIVQKKKYFAPIVSYSRKQCHSLCILGHKKLRNLMPIIQII